MHDTLDDAKESAIEWGANKEWKEETWKIAFSAPPEGFRIASFSEKNGMTIADYLKDDSSYID